MDVVVAVFGGFVEVGREAAVDVGLRLVEVGVAEAGADGGVHLCEPVDGGEIGLGVGLEMGGLEEEEGGTNHEEEGS